MVGGLVPAPLPALVRAPVELALERRVVLEARPAVEAAGLATTAFAAAGRALGAAAGGVELAAAPAATGLELAAAGVGDLAAAAPLGVDLGVGMAMAQKYGGWSDNR